MEHFDACLKVWTNSIDAHLLAARAARSDGDMVAADSHLRECQRLQEGISPDITFEWSLLRAASGELDEVERYLQGQVRTDPSREPLVLEAQAQGYLRVARTLEALACLDRWLQLDPNNAQAFFIKGNAWRRVQSTSQAAPEYRRVLELDPTRDDARWWLAVCLHETGRHEEAGKLFEQLRPARPGDPELEARLAVCYRFAGRTDEARGMLERVLADHPSHGLGLRAMGDLELAEGRVQAAEDWLRRAAAENPFDYRIQFSLAQCLQKIPGREVEARTQRVKAEKLKERLERYGEISSRQMNARPKDPDLHCELGVLLVGLGQEEAGRRWLISALKLNPQHAGAHAALASSYREQGDLERAEFHARQADATLSGASARPGGAARP
jgi:tetratricopeptide (TPR) repeat protein